MSPNAPYRRYVRRERLWLRRLRLPKLLLRQEYMVAVGRAVSLHDLNRVQWSAVLSRDLVTDAVAEFIADPFLMRHEDGYYLFFEVLNLETGRGELSVAHSPDLAQWSYVGVALREDCHLSYPYVFRHGGEIYMMPESSERGTVSLYRATDFPLRWERVQDLLTGQSYLDAGLFYEDGWWLVTSLSHAEAPLVYRAPDLFGPWTAVPAESTGNGRLMRSGGRIFQHGGQWYRPVQRQGVVYGEDVWIMRLELGAHGYRESLVTDTPQPVLAPQGRTWNSLGMHHLDLQPDGDGFLVAVDGKALVLETSLRRVRLHLRNKVGRGGA